MAGTDNHGALMEDWMLPTPSPRTLMSSFLNEEFSSRLFSDSFGDSGHRCSFVDSSWDGTSQVPKPPPQFETDLFGANQKSSSHTGLSERMLVRTGFRSLKIDTSHVGSSAPIQSPVTIPPGVSPRELLESPVFLPSGITQPSPTTGKLPFLMPSNVNLSVPEKAEDAVHDDCAFSFNPFLGSKPSVSVAEKCSSVTHQGQPPINDNLWKFNCQFSSTEPKDVTTENIVKHKTSDSILDNDHHSPANEQESEANENGEYSSAQIIIPDKDGYNWRKYGQKQAKNSEHPRSYYKCNHPNCPVKKKVERSQDGHITEIVYKCSHNHPLPHPNRRPGVPLSHLNDLKADDLQNFGSKPGQAIETSCKTAPNGHLQDVHTKIIETKLSASLTTTELAETSAMEAREALDVSSALSNEEDDRATHGGLSLGHGGNKDEAEHKRRKTDVFTAASTTTSTIDMGALAARAVREPRVVVQTTSEVDILDDGYRWRKYGQKVVKGNPNPRSYYKCTHPGCSVRKHVERASNDLKSVITTYEGKHNHEVPAARNSGHSSSGSGTAPPAPPQANGHQRRPELVQGSLAGTAAYGLPPIQQFGFAAGGIPFGMLPHGMAAPVPSPRTALPVKTSRRLPAMQGYPGVVLPRGEMKVNLFPGTNGTASAAYQQLMGRLPQGPEM